MSEVGIGNLITTAVGRDAVHVAVAPTTNTAGCPLRPGDRVDARGGFAGERVGIVDPFLAEPVKPGERFYLFLFPGSVTSLRHVWTHPAFAPTLPPKEPT